MNPRQKNPMTMRSRLIPILMLSLLPVFAHAEIPSHPGTAPLATILPVGIVKGIPDSTLLEIVQRQTFRYFWHVAHPVSGLIWNLFMGIPEIQAGLKKLGFTSPWVAK